MDAKDLGSDSTLSERSYDGNNSFTHNNPSNQYNDKNKSYHEIGSNSLPKVDVQTSRPCAVIGPDRKQTPSGFSNQYLKRGHVEPWQLTRPPEYPQKVNDYPHHAQLSPRQNYPENMQRMMMHNHQSEKLTPKNMSSNDSKYCEVPYVVNTVTSDSKCLSSADFPLNSNQVFVRNPAHAWPPNAVTMARPSRTFPAPDFLQYPEYSNYPQARGNAINQARPGHEEPVPIYPDAYFRNGNVRYEPYPGVKDRNLHARYDYINNYSGPYPPPNYPPYKYDLQKLPGNIPPHPYSRYPNVPLKYLENMGDPHREAYQRPANSQANYNVPFQHTHGYHYGPVPSNCIVNTSAKPTLDTHKTYVKYDGVPSKQYPDYYLNEVTRSHVSKPQMVMPGYPPLNMHSVSPHLLAQGYPYYRKDNNPQKSYEYAMHMKGLDSYGQSSRIVSHTSTNLLSPSETNCFDSQGLPISDDGGYVSQASSVSLKSLESGMSIYRGYDRRFRQSPVASKSENKVKKGIDLRQFLEMWNEGDDENIENNSDKAPLVQNDKQSEVVSSPEQLYVLGLVNVPSEELPKYEHIQKVSKLPDNIKGYTSIDLLNQFEQVINYSKATSLPQDSLTHTSVKPRVQNIVTTNESSCPLSPLDVEAKISQSVIHKEVGCNFEIKLCSPQMINVETAIQPHQLSEERVIEKVTNPLVEKHIGIFNRSINDVTNSSCKMVKPNYISDSDKTNYSIHDLESNSGVCLASLPRLDNDIELSFPEVNQQFINANKADSNFTHHQNIIKAVSPLSGDTINVKEISDRPSALNISTQKESEFSKLSKYRKMKDDKNSKPGDKTLLPIIRKDSVIIKNPENSDKNNSLIYENSAVEQSDLIKSSQSETSTSVNLTLNNIHFNNADITETDVVNYDRELKNGTQIPSIKHDSVSDTCIDVPSPIHDNNVDKCDKISMDAENMMIGCSNNDKTFSSFDEITTETPKNEVSTTTKADTFNICSNISSNNKETDTIDENICSETQCVAPLLKEKESEKVIKEITEDESETTVSKDIEEQIDLSLNLETSSVKSQCSDTSEVNQQISLTNTNNWEPTLSESIEDLHKKSPKIEHLENLEISTKLSSYNENSPICALPDPKIKKSIKQIDNIEKGDDNLIACNTVESSILQTVTESYDSNIEKIDHNVIGKVNAEENFICTQKVIQSTDNISSECQDNIKHKISESKCHNENRSPEFETESILSNSTQSQTALYQENCDLNNKQSHNTLNEKGLRIEDGLFIDAKTHGNISDDIEDKSTICLTDICEEAIPSSLTHPVTGQCELIDRKGLFNIVSKKKNSVFFQNLFLFEEDNLKETRPSLSQLEVDALLEDHSTLEKQHLEEKCVEIEQPETIITLGLKNHNDFNCLGDSNVEFSEETNLTTMTSKEDMISQTVKQKSSLETEPKAKCNSTIPRKRSLSDSALFTDLLAKENLKGSKTWPKRMRSDLEEEDQIQNRRNSTSSAFHSDVSFCILINNDCILSQNDDGAVCLTDGESFNIQLQSDFAETSKYIEETNDKLFECSNEKTILDPPDNSQDENWVNNVACIETVVSNQIYADDSNNKKDIYLNFDPLICSSHVSIRSDVNEIENSYSSDGENNYTENYSDFSHDLHSGTQFIENNVIDNVTIASKWPKHNDLLSYMSSSVMDITKSLESILSPMNNEDIDTISEDSENAEDVFPREESGFGNHSNTCGSISKNNLIEKKCLDTYEINDHGSQDNISLCKRFSSSPEVTSTTIEEKKTGILLKITNYNGSRVSELNSVTLDTHKKVRCKFTEDKKYLSKNNRNTTKPLITKAAKKYIPPLRDTVRDLKVKLFLPQPNLAKLKQLKITKDLPKTKEKIISNDSTIIPTNKLKSKQKPKFEDVLKSIDEINYQNHKANKKNKKNIPKVIIKKNNNGSHYTSTTENDTFKHDLTGRKWQPWVFIERDKLIDKMAMKGQKKAIYSYRKNCYILAEKFKKYKSVSSAMFSISQPMSNCQDKKPLKYTIKIRQ